MNLLFDQLAKHKTPILYGISLAFLMFFLKWLELRFIIFDHSLELYIGAIALLFTSLGIWLALKITQPKIQTIVVEKEIPVFPSSTFVPNQKMIDSLELSKRELEIMEWMSKGLSNQEIADKLFISLSTVKSHNQNIFEKLDVKRRTQVIEKAKRLQIIA